MIRDADFRVQSVRLVAFTPGAGASFNRASALSKLLPTFAARYDGPVEAPGGPPQILAEGGKITIKIGEPEILRMTSSDKQWILEISKVRTDSMWRIKPEEQSGRALDDVCRQCSEALFGYPFKNSEIYVGRLAAVVSRWYPCEEPSKRLANHFCRPPLVDESSESSPLRRSRGFRLDNLKKFPSPIGGRMVNSWVRCSSDKMINNQSGITVEHDLNSIRDDGLPANFSVEDARAFFEWVPAELDKILGLYFPGT